MRKRRTAGLLLLIFLLAMSGGCRLDQTEESDRQESIQTEESQTEKAGNLGSGSAVASKPFCGRRAGKIRISDYSAKQLSYFECRHDDVGLV